MKTVRWFPLSLLVLVLAGACAAETSTRKRASVLEFLYPTGTEAVPPSDVRLELPVRVGLAFAPSPPHQGAQALDEAQKGALLERVAEGFRSRADIERIEVVPSHHLMEGGGFANLEQVRGIYGVDLMALVSYEQVQFHDMNKKSVLYWTIVGAYFIPGDENETRTFVDVSVFDIRSRALLLVATGSSRVESSATALEALEEQRSDSRKGFRGAMDELTASLQLSLDAFEEQVQSGTVRGQGTPSVAVSAREGASGGGGIGAGALGLPELGAGLLLALMALARGRVGRTG